MDLPSDARGGLLTRLRGRPHCTVGARHRSLAALLKLERQRFHVAQCDHVADFDLIEVLHFRPRLDCLHVSTRTSDRHRAIGLVHRLNRGRNLDDVRSHALSRRRGRHGPTLCGRGLRECAGRDEGSGHCEKDGKLVHFILLVDDQ